MTFAVPLIFSVPTFRFAISGNVPNGSKTHRRVFIRGLASASMELGQNCVLVYRRDVASILSPSVQTIYFWIKYGLVGRTDWRLNKIYIMYIFRNPLSVKIKIEVPGVKQTLMIACMCKNFASREKVERGHRFFSHRFTCISRKNCRRLTMRSHQIVIWTSTALKNTQCLDFFKTLLLLLQTHLISYIKLQQTTWS